MVFKQCHTGDTHTVLMWGICPAVFMSKCLPIPQTRLLLLYSQLEHNSKCWVFQSVLQWLSIHCYIYCYLVHLTWSYVCCGSGYMTNTIITDIYYNLLPDNDNRFSYLFYSYNKWHIWESILPHQIRLCTKKGQKMWLRSFNKYMLTVIFSTDDWELRPVPHIKCTKRLLSLSQPSATQLLPSQEVSSNCYTQFGRPENVHGLPHQNITHWQSRKMNVQKCWIISTVPLWNSFYLWISHLQIYTDIT